jgi:transposase-like protein
MYSISTVKRFAKVDTPRIPIWALKLGIRVYLGYLSILDIVLLIGCFGVDRSRKAVHNWVTKADLQPTASRAPNQVALDETVIRVNDQQYWLYVVIDPETNDYLHVRLFPTYSSGIPSIFLGELKQKHDMEGAKFLVDGAPWLHAARHRHGLRFQHANHGNHNTIKNVLKILKSRTRYFTNYFYHADPDTVESWLQALASSENQLN